MFDVVVALIGIIVLAPLFVFVGCWIKMDSPGPVFFRQARVGWRGKSFRILKFRTMWVNAASANEITIGSDTRVTPVGRILRRYKIDELPQLINVLEGTMSLVGPRPEVPRYVAYYPADLRGTVLSVKPGITDWASIEFKDEATILAGSPDPVRAYLDQILPIKLGYHVRYVMQRSFGMDLRIIFATLNALLGDVFRFNSARTRRSSG